MLGKLLDRRYEVTQVLGAGGFGRTYLARDTRRPGHPICVVKQLKPLSTDPNFLETARRLFNSEAETLEQLGNHDQIPRLLAYFEEDQEFYLVQEFIEGHTLTQELQPGQRWEESRVIGMLEEVLTILDFVHRHGVIHRDIKPDNLIRRNLDKKLVLVDFGAVKQIRTQFAATQGRASNTVAVGTPGYMASEQALGQPRPSSDIYALGIIGIQALTGLMPVSFQEDLSTGEVLWQHLVPSVNRGFADILTKMVRYHFKDRYQSAAEALQALRQLNNPSSPAPYPAVPKTPSANDSPGLGARMPQPTNPVPQSNYQTLPASPAASPRQPVSSPSGTPSGSKSDKSPVVVGVLVALAVGAGGLALGLGQRGFESFFSGDRKGTDVAEVSEGTCTVVTGGLNVRSSPGGSVVETVTTNTKLTLTGKEKNGWLEISSPVKGWVYNRSDLVKCVLPKNKSVETAQATPKSVETTKATPKPVQPKPPKSVETPKPSPSTAPAKPTENPADTLKKAADKYNNGDLKGAIEDAQKIPPDSNAFEDAQKKIAKWQQDWAAAEAKYNELQKALDEGRWDVVLKAAIDPKFFEQRYWQDKFSQLVEEAKKRAAEEAKAQKDKIIPPGFPSLPQKPQPDTPAPEKPLPNSKGETQGQGAPANQ